MAAIGDPLNYLKPPMIVPVVPKQDRFKWQIHWSFNERVKKVLGIELCQRFEEDVQKTYDRDGARQILIDLLQTLDETQMQQLANLDSG